MAMFVYSVYLKRISDHISQGDHFKISYFVIHDFYCIHSRQLIRKYNSINFISNYFNPAVKTKLISTAYLSMKSSSDELVMERSK